MPDRFWLRACIAILALFAAGGLLEDLRHTAQGGAIDLRNRVTGARLAAGGIDPYAFKWTRDHGERLCDPYNTSQYPLSRTTSTPFVLALHVPAADLPYRFQQWAWLFLQYALLLASFVVWARGRRPSELEWGILFLLALCASPFWRLHVDRGQIYVLYGGLFLILASIRPAGGGLAFCTSAGSTLLIAMRPVYLAASAIPALWNVRRAVAGLLTGAIAAAGLPLLLCGHAIWFRYLDAMRLHSKLYLEGFQDQPSPTAFPPEIEGIPFDTLRTFARIPFADTSAYRLVSFELEPSWLLASWFLLMIAVLYRNARTLTPAQLWWAVCAWTIIGDFFLPALRNTYNDVAFLPFFLLGLTCLEGTARKVCQGSACVFFASHLATGFLPKAWIPVPSAIGFFIALAATVATVAFPQQLKGSRQGALKD